MSVEFDAKATYTVRKPLVTIKVSPDVAAVIRATIGSVIIDDADVRKEVCDLYRDLCTLSHGQAIPDWDVNCENELIVKGN